MVTYPTSRKCGETRGVSLGTIVRNNVTVPSTRPLQNRQGAGHPMREVRVRSALYSLRE